MDQQQEFPAELRAAQAVRGFVAEALDDFARTDDVVLVASELATNVIRHARTEFSVRLVALPDRIRLEVSDGSAIMPAVDDLSDSYSGLRVVKIVTDGWGVDGRGDGKTVWAEFRR